VAVAWHSPATTAQEIPVITALAPAQAAADRAAGPIDLVSHGGHAPGAEVLSVNLETVLRLTEQQNAQINLARERVREDCDAKAIDSWCCSKMTKARSKCLEKQVELSRTTSDTLVEAGNTYFDLLAARTVEAVLRDLETSRRELLDRAQRLAKTDPSAEVQVKAIKAAISGLSQTLERFHQQGDAAAAQLAYLLGLEGRVALSPTDSRLNPVQLVAADTPACQLVERALANGPGVRETRDLLILAQNSADQARKPCQWLPAPTPCGAGGAADGCGRASRPWCLNGFAVFHSHEVVRVAQSQLSQVEWNYQDLRGKLTAGVLKAHTAILSGREQMRLLEEQIRHAAEAYTLSNRRLVMNAPGSTIQEVGLTIDAAENAWRTYVEAMTAHNKAQLLLMIYLGQGPCYPGAALLPSPVPGPPAKREWNCPISPVAKVG
jgi:hypothetical protein